MASKLIYIGNGAFFPGVPARDLTDADITERELNEADLLKSGLYKKVDNDPAPKKSKALKDGE